MNRSATTALVALAGLAFAGCSSAAAASSGAKASPSPSPGRQRNGAAGELVKINGMALTLSGQNGDTNVVYTDSTTFRRTSTGTFADIKVGKCIVVTGPKDASGNITPANVGLTDNVNGTCNERRAGGGGGQGGAGGPGGFPSPRPGATPRAGNFGFVGGEVTATNGTAVQVKDMTGAVQSLNIPTTVAVQKSAPASASDLALHECIQANGQRDASGTVAARAITIVPAGPAGCFTGGRGGFFGGFGGRGAAGGPGGAGGGPPPGD